MTTSMQYIVSEDGNLEVDWNRTRLDIFGPFPFVNVDVNAFPHFNYQFNATKPLLNPCKLYINNLVAGDVVTITVSKG